MFAATVVVVVDEPADSGGPGSAGTPGGGAVPDVVMGAAGGQPGPRRRRGPVQGLHLGLLIHTGLSSQHYRQPL